MEKLRRNSDNEQEWHHFALEELYGTRYQSGSFSLINVGSGFHCLRNFSFLFFTSLCITPTSNNWKSCVIHWALKKNLTHPLQAPHPHN
jgi:hypothetical protein